MPAKVITFEGPHHHTRIYTRPLFVGYGITTSQGYIARAVATVVATSLTAPFHVVQTLAQVGSKEGRKSYRKIIEDLYEKEGLAAFFKGSLVGVLKFTATAGLNYLVYLGVKKILADKDGTLTLDNIQIANAASIIISSIITYPLETIRTRLILDWDKKRYTGAIDCLTNAINNEGWSALFQGATLSAVGNYLMVEIMERIWAPVRLGLAIVPPPLIEACIQTLCAQTLYYPIDTVIKMVQAPSVIKALHPDVKFDGVVEAATATVAKHGVLELWRGFGISAMQVVPYITIVGFSYEGCARIFQELNAQSHSHTPRVVVKRVDKIL